MVCAKDVMSKQMITVKEDTGLKEAIRLLVEHNVTGLPVVSEDMRLLGIVTEKDVLRALYDTSIGIGRRTVADLMTSEIISFDEDDDLIKVYESLMASYFRRVTVLSEGKLVGVISRRDMIKFLFESIKRKEALDTEYPDERRKYIRVLKEFKVVYSTPEAFGEDYIFNLSTGGLFVHSDSPLNEGEEVRLEVHLPDKEGAMEVLGKVIWSRAEEEVTPEGKQPPGMGVEFQDLSKEHIERIINVLSQTLY
jgi:uncharacterized protein (TIGR02266 family)